MTLFQLEARRQKLQEWEICNHSLKNRAKRPEIGIITGLINICKVNINPAEGLETCLTNDPFYSTTIPPK
jgi:hypothetical protein